MSVLGQKLQGHCFLDVFALVLGTRDRLMAHWKPFVLFVGDLAVWNDPCVQC